MDHIAEKLAQWFGSTAFILFHVIWFGSWIAGNLLFQFDTEWSVLTIIVSLEAIFLSLFILRAENIEAERQEKRLKQDLRATKEILERIESTHPRKNQTAKGRRAS